MCFTASASFASSAVLVTIGAVCMARARSAPQRFLACMPLLFAAQQFSEGFVWLSVNYSGFAQYHQFAMYAFLFMAQIGWPLFIPFSVLLVEPDAVRRRILGYFAVAGVLAGIYFTWCLVNFDAHVGVHPYHIQYELDFPLSKRWFYGLIYFIPAMLPTFISSLRRMRLLGILLLTSYLISRFFYRDYIVSVWCFFGALSSVTTLFIILDLNKVRALNKRIYTS